MPCLLGVLPWYVAMAYIVMAYVVMAYTSLGMAYVISRRLAYKYCLHINTARL